MQWISRIFDKTGAFGTLTAAMGCGFCFPALASLGATLGPGFLTQFEGLFINTLLPIFASIALAANAFSYFNHKTWYRTLIGITGPVIVLLVLYLLWSYSWSTNLFYAGLLMMMGTALRDIFRPAQKTCSVQTTRAK